MCIPQNVVSKSGATSDSRVENDHIESFNGKLRNECLNANQFLSINDARRKIKVRIADYNETQPHNWLGHLSSKEFLGVLINEAQRAALFQ